MLITNVENVEQLDDEQYLVNGIEYISVFKYKQKYDILINNWKSNAIINRKLITKGTKYIELETSKSRFRKLFLFPTYELISYFH